MDEFSRLMATTPVSTEGVRARQAEEEKSKSEGGSKPGQGLGVLLLSPDQIDTFCCGMIGPSRFSRFCLQASAPDRKGCGKDHRGSGGTPVLSENTALYIVYKDKKSAYVAPYLAVDRIESALCETWCSEKRPYDEWVSVFKAATATSERAGAEDVARRLADYQSAEGVATPAYRTRGNRTFGEEEEEVSPFAMFDTAELMPAAVEYWKANGTITSDFMDGTLGLEKSLRELKRQVPAIKADVGELRDQVSDDVELLSVRLGQLEAKQMSVEREGETEEDSGKHGEAILELERFVRFFKVERTPYQERVAQELEAMSKRIGLFTPWAGRLSDRTDQNTSEVQALTVKVDALMRETDRLRSELQQAQSGGLGVVGGMRMGNSVSPNELMEAMDEARALNTVLHDRMTRMEKQVNFSGSSFGGIELDSMEDTFAWVDRNMPDGKFGALVDFVSVFMHLYTGYTDTSDEFAQMQAIEKLKFASEHEARLAASFSNVLPEVFGKDKNFTKPLPALPKPENWSNPVERNGVKELVEEQLPGIKEKINCQILMMETEAGQVLARLCLDATIAFVTLFSNYITTLYESLTNTGGYDKTAAWTLTCKIGRRIFDEMAAVRVCAKGARVHNDPRTTTTKIVLGVLRTHAKMDEIFKARFENHPVISSEYVKFFASNSSSAKVEGLVGRVSTLEKEKLLGKKTMDTLVSKVASLELKKAAK